jgi:hypothetical protein
LSKPSIEKRIEELERQSDIGGKYYVWKISFWLPDGVLDPIYWLMRPTPDGKGECIKLLTSEEAATYGAKP